MNLLAKITPEDLKNYGDAFKPLDGDFFGKANANPLVSVIWNGAASLFVVAIYGFLLAMLIGATQYLISAGNDETIAKSKKTFINSLIGLVAVLASYQILTFLVNQLGPTIKDASLAKAVGKVYELVLGVAGGIFLILLLTGGFRYLTSAGNEEGVGKAKKQMLSSFIGIALIAFAYGIGKTVLILLKIPLE